MGIWADYAKIVNSPIFTRLNSKKYTIEYPTIVENFDNVVQYAYSTALQQYGVGTYAVNIIYSYNGNGTNQKSLIIQAVDNSHGSVLVVGLDNEDVSNATLKYFQLIDSVWNSSILATQEYAEDIIQEHTTDIIDIIIEKIYPIGSIYISVDKTSPAELFGGSWTPIESQFLYAVSVNKEALEFGGAETHTLNIDEMPSHTHDKLTITRGTYEVFYQNLASPGAGNAAAIGVKPIGDDYPASTRPISTSAAGGNMAFQIMPPYVTVYAWRRIE